LAAQHAPRELPKLVFVSLANSGFRFFALNLFLAAQKTKPPMRNLLFYALDNNVSQYLAAHGALVYFDDSSTLNVSSNASKFRSPDYSKIVGSKAKVAHEILLLGFDVFILDVDIALLRNPVNHIVDVPKCDLTVSLESSALKLLVPNENRYSGINFEAGEVPLLINTGVIMWRSQVGSLVTLGKFLQSKYRTKWPNVGDDQYEFNKFMSPNWPGQRRNSIDRDFASRHTTCSVYRNISVYVLSPVLFQTTEGAFGHANFANRFSLVPYIIHFTNVGDARGKLKAMRDHGLWLVKDSDF